MIRAVEARAERVAAGWRARVVERLRTMPGLGAEPMDDGVRVTGGRLRARWLTDARLRWLGGWM